MRKKITLSTDAMIELINELQESIAKLEKFLCNYTHFQEDRRIFVLSKLQIDTLTKIIQKVLLYHNKAMMRNKLSIAIAFNQLEIELILISINNKEVKTKLQPYASIAYLMI